MKKKTDLFCEVILLSVILSFNSACSMFSGAATPENTAKSANYFNGNERPDESPHKIEKPKIEKADFAMTADDYAGEFMREGVTSKDLEKYAKKYIAVTGQVKMYSFQKDGTAPPYIVLAAAGKERGVTCYHDSADVGGMKMVSKDKILTMQGFQDEFPMAGTSPALARCFVIREVETINHE